jgi:hypothetical protein
METVPAEITLPPAAWRHYRHFAWVIHEQRLLVLVLGFLLTACGLVWSLAWRLQHKPAVVVRAAPSLKEAAAAFYGIPEISYDQMAFFLHGCLPLLYATDDGGHRLLPLAQGLVAPEIYTAAERRLNQAGPAVLANRITQSLTITGVSDVMADAPSRRAAAYVRGYVTVTVRHAEAEFFPWRAQVLLEVNPMSRLSPWPFYLLRFEDRAGAASPAWDQSHDDRQWLQH